MSNTQETVGVMVDPGLILAANNARFGKPKQVDSLAKDIMDVGRVINPVEIEPLDKPVDGKKYSLNMGFRRLAAVLQLNKEQNLGLQIPAVIVPAGTAVDRLKRQISENIERENMSPMDRATAIQALLDLGVPNMEIRAKFPVARRKGRMQPLSASGFYKHLKLLDLPKAIQTKIDNGDIDISGAFELVVIMQKAKEKGEDWKAAVENTVAELESARTKELEREDSEEEKFLNAQKKVEAAEVKAQEESKKVMEAKAALKTSTELVNDLEKNLETAKAEAATAYQATLSAAKDEAKAAKEAHKEVETRVKTIQGNLKAARDNMAKAQKTVESAQERQKTAAEKAAERKEKLREAREAAAAAKKTETPAKKAAQAPQAKGASAADVKKASVAAGTASGPVALKTGEFKKALENLLLPSGMPKVQAIGKSVLDCWNGVITERQLVTALAVITGESKSAKAAQ